ncbi:MAG: hypothetical protein WA885_20540 [Phormidesmis sp.]
MNSVNWWLLRAEAQVAEPPDSLLNDTLLDRLRQSEELVPDVPMESATPHVLQQAADFARRAELLAQTAASAADWDGVLAQWLQAIALAQSIPPESPSRIVAQRQLRSYVQKLTEAQQRTEQASPTSGLPSLGSALLDAQLVGYLSYVATVGTPDILIVGSSRALQGIDPEAMQQTLRDQGYADLKVFNFSVNGATAQVVNFVLSELLPQPLPKVIVWGDGSRAFNDGRRDRTWESLVASPGYQAIRLGALPASLFRESLATSAVPVSYAGGVSHRPAMGVTARSPLPEIPGNLNDLGFSAVRDRFTPQTYYQEFPLVSGRYDGAYSPFALNGAQTAALAQLAAFTRAKNTQLIFVNLPLSGNYLDEYRLHYEHQFQQFLQTQSAAHGFEVVDLLTQWLTQPGLFADPSHINQEGAAAIAAQLASHRVLRAALSAAPSKAPEATSEATSEPGLTNQPTVSY